MPWVTGGPVNDTANCEAETDHILDSCLLSCTHGSITLQTCMRMYDPGQRRQQQQIYNDSLTFMLQLAQNINLPDIQNVRVSITNMSILL